MLNSIEVILQFSKLKINFLLKDNEEDEKFILSLVELLLKFDPKIKDGDFTTPTDFYLTNENLSTLFSTFHMKKWESLNILINILSKNENISYSNIENFNELISNEVDCLNAQNSLFIIDSISILLNTEDFENFDYLTNTIFDTIIHFDSKFGLGAFISFSSLIFNMKFWKRNIKKVNILKNLLKKILKNGKLHPR